MADHKPSKSKAKRAEKAPDQVVAAFSQALGAAFESEIENILGEFRKYRDIAHCLSGMLKSDTIQAFID